MRLYGKQKGTRVVLIRKPQLPPVPFGFALGD